MLPYMAYDCIRWLIEWPHMGYLSIDHKWCKCHPVVERLISLSWAGVAQKLRSLSLYTPHIPRKMFQQARSEHGLPAKKSINTVGLFVSYYIMVLYDLCCSTLSFLICGVHLNPFEGFHCNHSKPSTRNLGAWHVLFCPWNSRDNPRVVPVSVTIVLAKPAKSTSNRSTTQLL